MIPDLASIVIAWSATPAATTTSRGPEPGEACAPPPALDPLRGELLLAIVALVLVWLWARRRNASRHADPSLTPRPTNESNEDEDEVTAYEADKALSDDPVVLEIEDSIDLHGFAPRDVVDVVDAYLEAAHDRGLTEVRLIHGRGTGYQRSRVRSLLSKHPLVLRFADAPPHRGGFGATIAWLLPRTSASDTEG